MERLLKHNPMKQPDYSIICFHIHVSWIKKKEKNLQICFQN